MRNNKQSRRWYRLDNAGKLYPSIVSTRRSTVFRLSAKMNQPVDPEMLQQALNEVLVRFPYYKVNLKRGLFWYYFEEADHNPEVKEETFYPCMFMNIRTKKAFPFRVLYYNQYIHYEISHSMADGNSAMLFLKTLIARYVYLSEGVKCDICEGIMDILEEPKQTEWEDAFKRYYKKGIPTPQKSSKSIHFPFDLLDKGRYAFLTGIVPVNEVKALSKSYGCTVTVFMTALYFMAIQTYIEQLPVNEKKALLGKIVMNVPVDLRQLFPSDTMKNFFISFTPAIDLRLGHYELEEVIDYLKHYLKAHYNKKYISRYISRNVKNERSYLVRLLPLWFKNIIMPYIYIYFGERGYTSSVSNIGVVRMPEALEPYVENFEFYPAPSEVNKSKMCLCAYQDKITISFGKTTENTEIEKYFFRSLRKMGIPVKIETNLHQL